MKSLILIVAACSFLLRVGSSASAAETGAEYAIRWNAAEGGLKTAAQTLAAFGVSADDKDAFEIQYFTVAAPADLPSGFGAIARSRQKGKKKELTFKLRGPEPVQPLPARDSWNCGLGEAVKKDEIDISVLANGQVKRVFSRSCSIESKEDIAFPGAMGAKPKGCVSTMTRLKSGTLTVEEWLLKPSGVRLIEVSRKGADTNDELQAFRKDIVTPLLGRRIKPLDRSKSDVGSDCS